MRGAFGSIAALRTTWIFPTSAEQVSRDRRPFPCPRLRCSKPFEHRIGGWVPLQSNAYHYHWCNPGANNSYGARREAISSKSESRLRNCVDFAPEFPKTSEWRLIAGTTSVHNRYQLFGSYTAVPIGPGVRNLNPATGVRPAFITLFPQ